MTVCFYADLYFILNFIMNWFLLYITAWWLHEPAHNKRWVLLSAACAIFSVIITSYNFKLPINILAFVELVVLIWQAYRPENLKKFVTEFITYISLSAFTAGMIFMFKEVFARRKFSLLFLLLSVFILFLLFRFLRVSIAAQDLKRKSVVNATLVHNGKTQEIKALYDTGNHLVSPYTGEPVAVISRDLSEWAGLSKSGTPLLIPYHSIGGSGLLEAYRLDILKFQDGSTRKNFLAAVSDNICTDKEIQIILNNQPMAEGGYNA